jgi:predicted esterase
MDFRDVSRRVFDLYDDGRYEDGLEVIEAARPEHREEDGRLTFWEACLLGMSGAPEQALATLQAGMVRGLWWAPGMLADSDLDSVRGLEGWEELADRCSQSSADFSAAHRLETLLRPASMENPVGTVITLHGAGVDPIAHADEWREAVPDAWNVVVPVGTVAFSEKQWAWAYDGSADAVPEQLEALELTPPLVLAGWSQGAGVAAMLAWEGPLGSIGLVLMAPSFHQRTWDVPSYRPVPTYIVVGELDHPYLPGCLAIEERLREADVPVFLDQRAGMGHALPEDFSETLAAAFDWVVSHQG